MIKINKFVFKWVFVRWVGNHNDYNNIKNIDNDIILR